MKKFYAIISISMISSMSMAQNEITVDANDSWVAYVNVFDTSATGEPGAYLWGSQWALADLQTTLNTGANTITLQPNFNLYAADPTDTYWVNQTSGEGAKYISGSTYVEPGPGFNGQSLTFEGDVLSHTLDLTKYRATFYINALDSTNGYQNTIPLKTFDIPTSGHFTVSATAGELPVGMIIQYGFTVFGRNANPVNATALGSVVIGIDNAGISENGENAIRVYPNPANDLVYVVSEANINNITITKLSGQIVSAATALTGNSVDVSSLQAGVYIINASTDAGVQTTRLVKN